MSTESSREAEIKITGYAKTIRGRVLSLIKQGGATQYVSGWTPDEMVEYLNIDKNTLRPRFSELVRDGLIKDSGSARINKRGNKSTVYIATGPDEIIAKKQKKMKPVGNPELWGTMMRDIYAFAHTKRGSPEGIKAGNMMKLSGEYWLFDMANSINPERNKT